MEINIVLVIFVTSAATYISRFLGVLSAEKINENSKIIGKDIQINIKVVYIIRLN